eukprot:11732872-Karenia_brevis.AAC.1
MQAARSAYWISETHLKASLVMPFSREEAISGKALLFPEAAQLRTCHGAHRGAKRKVRGM